MKKYLGFLCVLCWFSTAVAEEDSRFVEPKKKAELHELHEMEKMFLSLKGHYDNFRTLQQVDAETRVAFDVEDSNVWLRFEKAI